MNIVIISLILSLKQFLPISKIKARIKSFVTF